MKNLCGEMEGPREGRVAVVPSAARYGASTTCGCCGRRYFPKKLLMWLSDARRLHGEICPDCILRGPRGAAGCLKRLLADLREETSRLRSPSRKGKEGIWGRHILARLEILEGMESFSVEARQAALRELREKR